MRVENEVLYIDDEINDEEVEEFFTTISQDEITKIEVNNPNLGASIIQILLIKNREKDIIVNDDILQRVFENISYKRI